MTMLNQAETLNVPEQRSPKMSALPKTWQNLPRLMLLYPIRLYQKTISPNLPADTCRYYPSCSHYGYQAIYKHGAIRGTQLAASRLLRCNPFSQGGFDPVP